MIQITELRRSLSAQEFWFN